jgi:hypothetical protein
MSLCSLLGRYPVLDSVSRSLALRDLFALSLVSKSIRCAVKRMLYRARDVDCALGEFFDDLVQFRERLRELPGAIVGDFAFGHFVGLRRQPVLLDVVNLGHPDAFFDFLFREGYTRLTGYSCCDDSDQFAVSILCLAGLPVLIWISTVFFGVSVVVGRFLCIHFSNRVIEALSALRWRRGILVVCRVF